MTVPEKVCHELNATHSSDQIKELFVDAFDISSWLWHKGDSQWREVEAR